MEKLSDLCPALKDKEPLSSSQLSTFPTPKKQIKLNRMIKWCQHIFIEVCAVQQLSS